jgi:isopentenyl diphosphate isomerase/L-lactate dehydrogenase-like FMN-dependent dehydrogenase
VADVGRKARGVLPRFAWDYLNGGLGTEACLDRNLMAFRDYPLIPARLRGNGPVDPAVDVFAHRQALPIGVSPVGYAGLFRRHGERNLARAAREAGAVFTQSTFSTETMDCVASHAGPGYWFQLYPSKDIDVTLDMVDRAGAAGAQALVVTIDVPIHSKRERDWRNGLSLSLRPSMRMIRQAMLRPKWSLTMLATGFPRLHVLEPYIPATVQGAAAGYDHIFDLMDAAFDMADLKRIRDRWQGPLIIKGVLDPGLARQLFDLGADAIQVSNHGGRQLDAAPASLHCLRRIVEVAGGKPVFVDGGIRSGSDVLCALHAGATYCFAGRPFYYAVAGLGAQGGARHIFALFRDEIQRTMIQLGTPTIEALRADPDLRDTA